MIKYIIALSLMGFNNQELIALIKEHISEIKNIFEKPEVLDEVFGLFQYRERLCNKNQCCEALIRAENILKKNDEYGIKTAYFSAANYPKSFTILENPPAIIYYKGNEFANVLNQGVACVGTRKPTRLSYRAVNYLVPQLVFNDCTIISGLALGVDAISHQACIHAGGKTIAVLAHGLDMVYPKENSALADLIVQSGGIIMSEYPVGVRPDKFRFVKRNRLIVGLAKAVIIYECDVNGGTMHNAEFAERQGKTIFCPSLPDEILEIQTGTEQLLKSGRASLIKHGRDIERILNEVGCSDIRGNLPANQIKENYFKTIISIIDSQKVFQRFLQEIGVNYIYSDKVAFYKYMKMAIEEKYIDYDTVLDNLVRCQVETLNPTSFPD